MCTLPPRKGLEIPGDGSAQMPRTFRKCMKLNWNTGGGGGGGGGEGGVVFRKNPFCRKGVDNFMQLHITNLFSLLKSNPRPAVS